MAKALFFINLLTDLSYDYRNKTKSNVALLLVVLLKSLKIITVENKSETNKTNKYIKHYHQSNKSTCGWENRSVSHFSFFFLNQALKYLHLRGAGLKCLSRTSLGARHPCLPSSKHWDASFKACERTLWQALHIQLKSFWDGAAGGKAWGY